MGAVAWDADPRGRYRHLVCGNFRIFYRLTEGSILVVRVWDSRRNPRALRLEPARR